jgi:hypothetical protein
MTHTTDLKTYHITESKALWNWCKISRGIEKKSSLEIHTNNSQFIFYKMIQQTKGNHLIKLFQYSWKHLPENLKLQPPPFT